jgi:Cu(I)/Ag(I) efflux system membrane fusion protein
VYETYFEAGEALTKDDLKGAKKALSELVAPVKKVSPPKGEQYEAWGTASKALLKVLEHARHIEGLPDARSMFEKVSRHIITVNRHCGRPTDGEYFLAFCPMAFGNKGAYWLQEQEKVANPYFGAKMLRCGEIRESMDAE